MSDPTGNNGKGNAKLTSDTLGLKDNSTFLKSSSTVSSDTTSHASFRDLVKLAVNSATTDLLNVLNKISGFGQNQNPQSGGLADPTADTTKQGAGYVSTEQSIKSALKDLLKPNE